MASVAQSLNVLPAPPSARQDDFIYVSTIYPLTPDGSVVHSDAISPFVGESEMAAQTRAVLDTLGSVLDAAGSSLPNTLKAEVYLVDASDFYEFKLVWKQYFPTDPPVRTTAIVGDDHIVPGCLLSLSAVALANDASAQRETIHVDDVPDPMEAEWVPQAIKAAPFVWPTPLPATDFETGVAVGRNPIAPYYGSDAEMQAHFIFQNWDKILKAAGSGLDQALKSQAYEVDLATFHDMDGIWGQYMGWGADAPPPTRSSMAMRGLLVPGAAFVANLQFLAADADYQKEETRKGIAWHPEDVRAVHFSPGLTAGDWFFMAGQVACGDFDALDFAQTPKGLPYYSNDIEVQTAEVLRLLGNQLAANEMSLSNVVDARVFLVEPRRDYRGFERAWREVFEPTGHLPTINLIPSKQENGGGGIMMPNDLWIEIDLIAHRQHGP